MAKHGDNLQYEPASRVCPLCFRFFDPDNQSSNPSILCSRPRIEHKNRCLSEEEKGSHRGNLYKCCHCAASKLSAKKFFVHLENHVSVLIAPTRSLFMFPCVAKGQPNPLFAFSLSPILQGHNIGIITIVSMQLILTNTIQANYATQPNSRIST